MRPPRVESTWGWVEHSETHLVADRYSPFLLLVRLVLAAPAFFAVRERLETFEHTDRAHEAKAKEQL